MDNTTLISADAINREHELAHSHAETAIRHAIRCGELLAAKKTELPHGSFQSWIKANCQFEYSTAARYMKAARQISTGVEISRLSDVFPSGQIKSAVDCAFGTDAKSAADFRSDEVPWNHDNVSWLPEGNDVLRATVTPDGNAEGGVIYVQQSGAHSGYWHFVLLFDPVYPGEEGGIYGGHKPVLGAACTWLFRSMMKREPSEIGWERLAGKEGYLDGLISEWLPPPWLVEARNRAKANETGAAGHA